VHITHLAISLFLHSSLVLPRDVKDLEKVFLFRFTLKGSLVPTDTRLSPIKLLGVLIDLVVKVQQFSGIIKL
jgi:hypothetical protein